MKKLLLSTAFLVAFSFAAKAQEINTDRPDQTENTRTIGKRIFQIESGLLAEFTGQDSIREQRWLLPTALFRVGISEWMEIRVVSQLENQRFGTGENNSTSRLGISNFQLGAKIKLLQPENQNIEISFLSHVVFPTGSFAEERNNYGSINRILFAQNLGEKVSVGYNIGYDYFGMGSGDLAYTLSFNFMVGEYLALFCEPYGSILDLKTHEASFDAGFTYLLRENMQADFSFGTGINYEMNFVSVGFSILMDGNKRGFDRKLN